MADNLVHQQDNRATIFFGQSHCAQSQLEAFGNAGGRNGNQPVVAVGAPAGLHNLALGRGGGLAGSRAHTLYVHDYAGDFGDAGQAQHFLLQGEAGATGSGHSLFASHGSANNGAEACDFVLGLHKFAANLGQTQCQLFSNFSRRGDRITTVEFYAGSNRTLNNCLVTL